MADDQLNSQLACHTGYLYFGKESVVARHLGMDARTVTAILEEVAASNPLLHRITQTNKLA